MKRRFAALAVAWICTLALGGCDAVDRFSGRAVQYNLEAEQVQDQGILLNIIRASKRRPLEFTSISTVTGTASASGNGGLTGPVGPHLPTSSHAFSLGLTVSGGPTFSLGVLDTQEFYEGISNPIPVSLFDFYLKEGYPPNLLFNLFISKIELIREGHHETLANAPSSESYTKFQAVLDEIINQGLTTEKSSDAVPQGPPLTPNETGNVKELLAGGTQGYELHRKGWCDLAEEDREVTLSRLRANAWRIVLYRVNAYCKTSGDKTPPPVILEAGLPPYLYQVQKANSGARFCFTRGNHGDAQCSMGKKKSKSPSSTPYRFTNLDLSNVSEVTIVTPKGTKLRMAVPNTDPNFRVTELTMTPRTTEGVIYYLGELVRQAHYPEFQSRRFTPKIVYGPTSIKMPEKVCPASTDNDDSSGNLPIVLMKKFICMPIFVVDQPAANQAFVSVAYDGTSYGIPTKQTPVALTYQVLDLVSQLIALNKSAKSLPATSVFTIIGSP